MAFDHRSMLLMHRRPRTARVLAGVACSTPTPTLQETFLHAREQVGDNLLRVWPTWAGRRADSGQCKVQSVSARAAAVPYIAAAFGVPAFLARTCLTAPARRGSMRWERAPRELSSCQGRALSRPFSPQGTDAGPLGPGRSYSCVRGHLGTAAPARPPGR